MVSSPKLPHSPRQKGAAQDACENETHIHIIVCSCNSIALGKDYQFPGAKTCITSLPELLHLRGFTSNFVTPDMTTINLANQQNYLQPLGRGGLQAQDLVSRSKKYIQNPLRIIGLAKRTRVCSQGLLNPRLWFSISVVIVWLLVRRTLEIFGIYLPGLVVTLQNNRVSGAKSNTEVKDSVDYSGEYDLVRLDAH